MFDFLSPLQQFTLDTTLITTLLVISVHITFRAGLFSLAPLGFAAIGSYTTAVLVTKKDWPVLGGIAAGVVFAAALAAVFAIPVLRLRGIYFALGTVALAQATIVFISNFDITNTTLGISGIPNDIETWHLIVILLVVFTFLQLEHRSRFGRALAAVRLDERTASGLGINVKWLRFTTFVASAGLAGLAGALEAHRTTVISPEQYAFGLLIPLFTYALVGGHGHWLGPVLTAWALTALRNYMDFSNSKWEDLIYGTLLVVVMLLAPSGLTDPTIARKLGLRRKRKRRPSSTLEPDPAGLTAAATAAPTTGSTAATVAS